MHVKLESLVLFAVFSAASLSVKLSLFPTGPEFEHSEILLNKTEYWELLKEWLAPVFSLPSKWKLCYRATDHGWASSTFHSRCNSKGPTVSFIKVNEFIFGGYTDQSWREYHK